MLALPWLRRGDAGWQPGQDGRAAPVVSGLRVPGLRPGARQALWVLARGHCGEVRVRSTPSTGSRFDLMLPAMMAAGERPAAVPAAAMMARDWPAPAPARARARARAGQPRGNWTRQ